MQAFGLLSAGEAAEAERVLLGAAQMRDSLLLNSRQDEMFDGPAELTRALEHVTSFFLRGLFEDTARFNRMLDHVLVTEEYVRGGSIQFALGQAYPRTTPYLGWQYYPDAGIYFQPTNTVNPFLLVRLLPRRDTPLDSLAGVTDHLFAYALWRTDGPRRFPVWEYHFPFTSGGVHNNPPWISSLSQGLALMAFTERFRRTGEPLWRERAYQVYQSFSVPWTRGGIRVDDTAHGYWWEEFDPSVQIWNGSVWAALAVGYLWQVTSDPDVERDYRRGIDAIKYYTPDYDTGSWTLYSRTQGYNTVAYHHICITLMEQFFTLTGDPWFDSVATRWRSYVPPPGVH
jgi:hypothetical protein